MYAKRVNEIRIASDLARLAVIEERNPNLVYLPNKDYNQSIRIIKFANELKYSLCVRAWRNRGGNERKVSRR